MKGDLADLTNRKSGKPRLLGASELPAGTTKGELVVAYGMDFTFDFAIPNDWACNAQRASFPNGGWWSVVWAYDKKGGCCGRPFPLTLEALDTIKKTNGLLGWTVPTDEDFEFFRIERDLPVLQ